MATNEWNVDAGRGASLIAIGERATAAYLQSRTSRSLAARRNKAEKL
jgi:hypothetical protein